MQAIKSSSFRKSLVSMSHASIGAKRLPCRLTRAFCEANENYLLENPLTYQFSRIHVAGDGHRSEGTRQYLCAYCQQPEFFSFYGNDGLIMHWRHSHPKELPQFVVRIMKLHFLQIMPPNFEAKIVPPNVHRFLTRLPQLLYRADVDANRLTFSPRPSAPPTMKLSDLTEDHLIWWYLRDIQGFNELSHGYVKYVEFQLLIGAGQKSLKVFAHIPTKAIRKSKDPRNIYVLFVLDLDFARCSELWGGWVNWQGYIGLLIYPNGAKFSMLTKLREMQ